MGKLKLLLIPALALFIFSCEVEPGPGGAASISGQVYWRDCFSVPILSIYDSVLAEYPAVEERVYLIYGDSSAVYSDDFRTDYDGRFTFDYLKKGDYTIYAYQKCAECNEGLEPVFVTVEIEEPKGDNTSPIIYLKNDISD